MSNQTGLSRREILRRTALVLGVSALSPALRAAVMAGAEASGATKPVFLSSQQLRLVAVLTEMILPATDTPGAEAAGVHHFIDVLLGDYFSAAHRNSFMKGLANVDARARAQGFEHFLAADAETRHEIAVALDHEAYSTATTDDTAFFRELKELTLVGYYTSKAGATEELIYEPIPGEHEACIPYKSVGRAWATAN